MIKRIQDIDKIAAAKASIFHIGLIDDFSVESREPKSFTLDTFVYDGIRHSTKHGYIYHIDDHGKPSMQSKTATRTEWKVCLGTRCLDETSYSAKHFNLRKLGRYLIEQVTDERCGLVVVDNTNPGSIYSYKLETERDRIRILDWFRYHQHQLPERVPLKYISGQKVVECDSYEIDTRTLEIRWKGMEKPLKQRTTGCHPVIRIQVDGQSKNVQFHNFVFTSLFDDLWGLNQDWIEFDHMADGVHLTRPCSRYGNVLAKYDVRGSKITKVSLPETIPNTLDEDIVLGNEHKIIYDETGPYLYIGRHRNIYDRRKLLKRFSIGPTHPYPMVQVRCDPETDAVFLTPPLPGQKRVIKTKLMLIHIIVCSVWNVVSDVDHVVVRHLDADKTNYNLDNLRWGTRRDNALDQHDNPETTSRKRVIAWPFEEEPTTSNIIEFSSIVDASKSTGCIKTCIGNVCARKKHNLSLRPKHGPFAKKRMTFRFA